MNDLEKILESRERLKANIQKTIIFTSPIIERDGIGIIYPKTINIIQGKSGVHKSRLAETICSSLLSNDHSTDYLGFKTNAFYSYTVLYVDTERNESDQFPYALQQIIKKAGFSDAPHNFDFFSLIQIKRTERFESLKKYLEKIRAQIETHLVIFLDVITDCISSFNDARESLELIDLLNIMINQYNVTFICLIHENPGIGEKARGHLGTELMNKASTVLQIGFEKDKNNKDSELIKLSYLKCRNSKKPSPVYLQYHPEFKGLIIADHETIDDFWKKRKSKANLDQIKEYLGKELSTPLPRKELLGKLTQTFNCATRTIETRLSSIIEDEEIIFDGSGKEYILNKETVDRETVYSLQPFKLLWEICN